MKKTFLFLLLAHLSLMVQGQELRYTNASDLNIIGRIDPVTHSYHRVEVSKYPGLTTPEAALLRQPAGMAVVFRTDSPVITVRTKYKKMYNGINSPKIAGAGYDLYIRKEGNWLYAASWVEKSAGEPITLVKDMDPSVKECLLYLPLFSEVDSVEIGTAEGSVLESAANPFRHRIIYFGSSFTHGSGASRAGMNYPAQLGRSTGLYFINLGVSGNSKLQIPFADILCAGKPEAIVVDGFSNPLPEEIEARLFPFIARIRETLPDTPIIFVGSIYRECSNFDLVKRANLEDRMARGARMARQATAEFRNVHFLEIPDLAGNDHITSTDGVHPSDLGYWRWANNLQKPLLKILAKYGIK